MINARIDRDSKMPLWAAFGAPFIGVPLLVGLLVLSAPDRPAPEVGAEPAVEQVGVVPTETAIDTNGVVGTRG